MYLIRVDFPDDDKYAFVTNDEGDVRKFYDYAQALEECRRWATAIVIEVKDESQYWEISR